MTVLVGSLLFLAVAVSWIAALALLRLPTPLQRLHTAAVTNILAGSSLAAAAWLSDGVSPRSGKSLMIGCLLVIGGTLATHVIGRAIYLRSASIR